MLFTTAIMLGDSTHAVDPHHSSADSASLYIVCSEFITWSLECPELVRARNKEQVTSV